MLVSLFSIGVSFVCLFVRIFFRLFVFLFDCLHSLARFLQVGSAV
jgi:hypothetical protein